MLRQIVEERRRFSRVAQYDMAENRPATQTLVFVENPDDASIVGRECVEQTNIKPREPPSAHDDHGINSSRVSVKSKTTVAVAAQPEALTICNASWNEKNSGNPCAKRN